MRHEGAAASAEKPFTGGRSAGLHFEEGTCYPVPAVPRSAFGTRISKNVLGGVALSETWSDGLPAHGIFTASENTFLFRLAVVLGSTALPAAAPSTDSILVLKMLLIDGGFAVSPAVKVL